MEGTHPFAGAYLYHGDPPPYGDRISSGHFPYGLRKTPYRPSHSSPPIELLHPTVRCLMLRCFEDGRRDPEARPDAQTWLTALREAEHELKVCEINPQHFYGRHLSSCPWCERKLLRWPGRDPFPTRSEAQEAAHSPTLSKIDSSNANTNYGPHHVVSHVAIHFPPNSYAPAPVHSAAQPIRFPVAQFVELASGLVFCYWRSLRIQIGAPGISISITPVFHILVLLPRR